MISDMSLVILRLAATELTKLNWRVALEQLSSQRAARSDIVATSPDGRSYVVEINVGEGRTHFSEIAQVESLATDLRVEKENAVVTPVLLTTKEVPPSIHTVAESVGVEIIEATGSDIDVANALVAYLQDRGHAT